MVNLRTGTYAAVLLLIVSGVGIAWGAKTIAATERSGDVLVDWERIHNDGHDVVRVWLRNAGERELEGSPKILILNENGGLRQSFVFGEFVMELDPDESVYVDWSLGATHRCNYGMLDAQGAPSDVRYPCPGGDEPTGQEMPGATCYDCRPSSSPFQGRFILVGVFGEYADATVAEIG